jgi:NAD-dependent deacetylase
MEKDITTLRNIIANSDRITALTGAGISAESGVPTFRGEGGMWKTYQVTEVATPQAFASNPEMVWEFYNWRRNLIADITFNPGHKALVTLEEQVKDFTLITQNVDGLHRKAGSKNLLEMHGNLWEVRCTKCGELKEDRSRDMGRLPACKECGGLLRPNVVWFGETLDPDILRRSIEAVRNCELMFIIGTSGIVQPAASLAFEAKSNRAVVAEVNIERTPQSGLMDFVLTGQSGEILPMLV